MIILFHIVESYRALTNPMPLFVETLQVSNKKKKTNHDFA